jgi:altronate dehydratase
MGFTGFRRKDGTWGVRNHVVVMSSVSCANGVVRAIGRALPEVKTITHTEGCGRALDDVRSPSAPWWDWATIPTWPPCWWWGWVAK